ncbi:cytochrome P450 [Hypoxylon sp. NC1633]|nr:cytochrome P450 [Hypoxylon sp. NC1633]
MSALLTLVISAIIILFVTSVKSWYRLRNVPGPFITSFSSWWMVRHSVGARFHVLLADAANEYGSVVRIGPNEVVCSNPDALRQMSAVRSPFTKGEFYKTGRLVPGEDTIISVPDNKHKELKAKLTPGYSGRLNGGFEAGIDRQISSLLQLVDKYANKSTPMDMSQKTQFLGLDVIGDITFGQPFGFLRQDNDICSYISVHDSSMPGFNLVTVLPWLTEWVHRWPLNLMLPKTGDKTGLAGLSAMINTIVDKRLTLGAKAGKDMLQGFINSGLNRQELMSAGLVNLIAGSDSTAHAIRMTLLCLITSPKAYSRLQTDIDASISTSQTPVPSPAPDALALSLPYLNAVIKEALRIHPPVFSLAFKQVPPGGAKLDGVFLPGGTQVGHSHYGVGRSRKVWGEDAAMFKPERWLASDAAGKIRVKKMEEDLDLVFGHGKYRCMGQAIAMMEIRKSVFELLRHFDFAVIDQESPISISSALFMCAKDFALMVEHRSTDCQRLDTLLQ